MKALRRITNQASRWTLPLYLVVFVLAGIGHPFATAVPADCASHGTAVLTAAVAETEGAHHCPSCAVVSAVAGAVVATHQSCPAPAPSRLLTPEQPAPAARSTSYAHSSRGPPSA